MDRFPDFTIEIVGENIGFIRFLVSPHALCEVFEENGLLVFEAKYPPLPGRCLCKG